MISILQFQIMFDVVFFVLIMLLLRQLHRRIAKIPPAVDEAKVLEVKKIVMDSQEYTNQFLKTVEENELRLNKLARQLDDKEKKLMILLEEVETLMKNMDSRKASPGPVCANERYDDLLKMLRQGISREEIAKRSGFTEGEINLVMELGKTRTDPLS